MVGICTLANDVRQKTFMEKFRTVQYVSETSIVENKRLHHLS